MLVNSLPKKLGGQPSKRKVGETVLTAEELFTYGTEKQSTVDFKLKGCGDCQQD